MGDIFDRLEQARSQIESKFSEAGSFLQDELELIGRQLALLGNLGKILQSDAVDGAAQDLVSTADHLNALPSLLASRDGHLHNLHLDNAAVQFQVREMRGLLRYLRTFALNVKITAAGMGVQSGQFDAYAHEMNTRICEGGKLLDALEADLQGLDGQLRVAQQSEAQLAIEARRMLPEVPRRLSHDAAAIGTYHKRVAEMTGDVATLAQRIQTHVLKTLSALQIGDSARQRIEHVQQGLAALADLDLRLAQDAVCADVRARIDRYVSRMLAAQLLDTAHDFDAEATRMLAHMGDMADDTQTLLRLQQPGNGTSKDFGLRSLEQSVANALVLVSAMDRASESADVLRLTTSEAVRNLVTRMGTIKDVKDDVQYMALNTTLRCAHIGDAGKPLQVVATELSIYAKRLETVADATISALQQMSQNAERHGVGDDTQANATAKLEASIGRLRTAADVVEKDLGSASEQGRSLVASLAGAGDKLDFKTAVLDVMRDAADALTQRAGEDAMDIEGIELPLGELLGGIARTYTMAREREVHAQYAPAGMVAAAVQPAPAAEDDIELFA